jgi:hypothetical protein
MLSCAIACLSYLQTECGKIYRAYCAIRLGSDKTADKTAVETAAIQTMSASAD